MPAVPTEAPQSLPLPPLNTRGGRSVTRRPWRAAYGATAGFRRLLAMRFATQWGDGLFQAALGGAVLFNPEREADPLAVAAALAVMLIPYSVIGPFAGALLDRWDRRQVLLVASLLRAVLVASVAVTVAAGVAGAPLYLGALAVAGVSRFALAGLSAALPHVVDRRRLVAANVVATTLGAAFAALGAGSAILLRGIVGPGDTGSAVTTAVAVVGSLIAAGVALGVRRGLLGPDHPVGVAAPDPPVASPQPRHTMVAVARGLAVGARATAGTPPVAAAFLALAAHRLAFGITTLVSLLLFRHAFDDAGLVRSGLAGVGEAMVMAAAGLGVAAVLTPWLTGRFGRGRTVRIALLVAVVGQLGLALLLSAPAVLAAAFLLGCTGQIVKLCADAGVQSEIDDDVRGQVFALYDAGFNVCYVAAVAVAALLCPPNGWAPGLLAAAAALYLVGLLAHDALLRRARS
ncbi:MFS transporter [Pseudonocardia sp.]|uniref:MFS transporter n=1 Tax=Pseudonocardia sp. TaxID=60912 RepID=UPI003D126DD8